MNKFVLAALMSMMAVTAQAGEDFSLWSCGLKFGDQPKTSQSYTAWVEQRGSKSASVVRSIESPGWVDDLEVVTFLESTSNHTLRRRLPETLTFAKLVCSWR